MSCLPAPSAMMRSRDSRQLRSANSNPARSAAGALKIAAAIVDHRAILSILAHLDSLDLDLAARSAAPIRSVPGNRT